MTYNPGKIIADLKAKNEILTALRDEAVFQLSKAHVRITESEVALKESKANDMQSMRYLADARLATGDDGKRMLPEFIEYLKALKQERDELKARIDGGVRVCIHDCGIAHWVNAIHDPEWIKLDGAFSANATLILDEGVEL